MGGCQELESLLAESLPAARARAAATFEELAGPYAERLVLFGAGGLGRMTLAALRAEGGEPLAFADNNPDLWGRRVEGLAVLNPQEAAQEFGRKAAFVVTIWRAGRSQRFVETRAQLSGLGCETIIPFLPLFWKHAARLLPFYMADQPERTLSHAEQVRRACGLLTDADSRREYMSQIRWRLQADFDSLGRPAACDQYFPPELFTVRPDESFVDCGAFPGDAIQGLLARAGKFRGRVCAFEPDPQNFLALQEFVADLPEPARIAILPLAVSGQTEVLRFGGGKGVSSGAAPDGDSDVQAVSLDEYLVGQSPTFIKMDIEGGEEAALRGAAGLIRRCRPILAVCVYHRPESLWQIPLSLAALVDDYSFHLRLHNEEGWDTVLYAIPKERLVE